MFNSKETSKYEAELNVLGVYALVGSLDVDVFINYLRPFRGILIAGNFPLFSVCSLVGSGFRLWLKCKDYIIIYLICKIFNSVFLIFKYCEIK